MREQLTPRQLLTALQPGQHHVMLDPKHPGKVICQVSRVADVYYLTGPLFNDYLKLELQPLFEAARRNNDDEATTVGLLNKFLGDQGVPVESQVATCIGLDDAISKLAGLFAAYSLLSKI